MASDQILALNVLMRALENPLKVYNRALRKAWATETDSDPFKAAVVKGNGALLEIEQVVRQWVAGHPEPAATPCSDPPCDHDGSGEPCDTHETEQAHADGDHGFCGITCEAEFTSEKLRNGILWSAAPGSARMLDELLRRAGTISEETPGC